MTPSKVKRGGPGELTRGAYRTLGRETFRAMGIEKHESGGGCCNRIIEGTTSRQSISRMYVFQKLSRGGERDGGRTTLDSGKDHLKLRKGVLPTGERMPKRTKSLSVLGEQGRGKEEFVGDGPTAAGGCSKDKNHHPQRKARGKATTKRPGAIDKKRELPRRKGIRLLGRRMFRGIPAEIPKKDKPFLPQRPPAE